MDENTNEEFLTFVETEETFLEAEQEVIEAPKKPSRRRRKKPNQEAHCEPEMTEDGLQACPKVKRSSYEPPLRPLRRNVIKTKRGMPKIK